MKKRERERERGRDETAIQYFTSNATALTKQVPLTTMLVMIVIAGSLLVPTSSI